MPTNRNPVLGVLKYFQEADLALAQQALTLAQQVIRGRTAATAKAKPAVKKVALPGPVATVGDRSA